MNRWREFHRLFMSLRDEEEQVIQQHAPRFYLRATGTRGGPNLYGLWEISHQVSDNFQAKFELTCADAAKHLGCPDSAHPISKKWENHAAAIMLWFAYYNFCRIHKSLRVTPAMEAGIADHP